MGSVVGVCWGVILAVPHDHPSSQVRIYELEVELDRYKALLQVAQKSEEDSETKMKDMESLLKVYKG